MKISETNRYIEFLRYCLDTSREIPQSVADINWHALLLFAREHAIVGIYWQGIITTPNQPKNKEFFYGNKPTDDDIMEWMADIQDIISQNKIVDEAAKFVAEKFERKGFDACLLKGQGNALHYPTPELRCPGDVDIWVRPRKDRNIEKKKDGDISQDVDKVIKYVQQFMPWAKASYHHIDFVDINGVSVEVHYRPSFMYNPINNKHLQKYFIDHADEQFKNDSHKGFKVPALEFNLLFQQSHIFKHWLSEGIGLRQIIDYYYLLKRNYESQPNLEAFAAQKARIKKAFQNYGMINAAGALSWVLVNTLGIDEKYIIIKPKEQYGRFFLKEIIKGGNFGKFNEDINHADFGTAQHNINRLKWDIDHFIYFPSECFWEPLFRVWHFFWRKEHMKAKFHNSSTMQVSS